MKRQWLLVCMALCLGVLVWSRHPVPMMVLILLLVGYGIRVLVKKDWKRPLVLVLCLGLALGAFSHAELTQWGLSSLDSSGPVQEIKGRVVLDRSAMSKRWYVDQVHILEGGVWRQVEGKLACREDLEGSIKHGARVRFTGKLEQMDRARNPGGMDWHLYWYLRGVVGRVEKVVILEWSDEPGFGGPGDALLEVSHGLQAYLYDLFSDHLSGNQAPIAFAMVTGVKDTLDKETKASFQALGIAHLLTVSGLHIGLAYFGLDRLLVKLESPRWLRDLLGASLLLALLVLSGFRFSGLRAAGFVIMQRWATLTKRPFDGLTSLAMIGLVQVLASPFMVFDMGFQLAFGAVFAIFGPGKWLTRRLTKWSPTLAHFLAVPLAVQLVLAPIILLHTGQGMPYGWLFNIPAAVVSGLIVPLLVVSSLLGKVPLVGGFLFSGVSLLIEGLMVLPKLGSFLPGLLVSKAAWSWKGWLIWLVILGALVGLPNLSIGRTWSKGHVARLVLMACAIITLLPSQTGTHVRVLDVGQGDALLIQQAGGMRILVDWGKYEDLGDVLLKQGVDHIDVAIISHPHADHLNGILALPESIGVDEIWYSHNQVHQEGIGQVKAAFEGRNTVFRTLQAGEGYQLGRASLYTLWPKVPGLASESAPGFEYRSETGGETDLNNDSLVQLYSEGDFQILLTGDVEEEGEVGLLADFPGTPIPIDLYKVGHHGSGTSSTPDLLKRFPARVATISCGQKNSYGHPSKEVVDRLAQGQTLVFRTDLQGAIDIWALGSFRIVLPWLDWSQLAWYNE